MGAGHYGALNVNALLRCVVFSWQLTKNCSFVQWSNYVPQEATNCQQNFRAAISAPSCLLSCSAAIWICTFLLLLERNKMNEIGRTNWLYAYVHREYRQWCQVAVFRAAIRVLSQTPNIFRTHHSSAMRTWLCESTDLSAKQKHIGTQPDWGTWGR